MIDPDTQSEESNLGSESGIDEDSSAVDHDFEEIYPFVLIYDRIKS